MPRIETVIQIKLTDDDKAAIAYARDQPDKPEDWHPREADAQECAEHLEGYVEQAAEEYEDYEHAIES